MTVSFCSVIFNMLCGTNVFSLVDKNEFFRKYGSIFTMCKNYTEAVYREKICDGRNDCVDKTDEEDCTACKLII